MLTRSNRPRYTPEEYLKLEETSEEKHEFFQGEIFIGVEWPKIPNVHPNPAE